MKKSLALNVLYFILIMNSAIALANSQTKLTVKAFSLDKALYQLEIAQTYQQLQTGLMGRTHVPMNTGMLFVFPSFTRHGIWMKNVPIPLTVAWLDRNLRVTSVHRLVPCAQYNCPITIPKQPSAYVLELNADAKIKVGDQLTAIMK